MCMFSPSLRNDEEKSLLNEHLKKIFELDATNVIEEYLMSLLKAQLAQSGLKSDAKQMQKVIGPEKIILCRSTQT